MYKVAPYRCDILLFPASQMPSFYESAIALHSTPMYTHVLLVSRTHPLQPAVGGRVPCSRLLRLHIFCLASADESNLAAETRQILNSDVMFPHVQQELAVVPHRQARGPWGCSRARIHREVGSLKLDIALASDCRPSPAEHVLVSQHPPCPPAYCAPRHPGTQVDAQVLCALC